MLPSSRKQKEIGKRAPMGYWHREFGPLLKYGSLKKYLNLASALRHYFRGHSTITSFPLVLKVEISRWCTVNCRYCYVKKDRAFYPFDEYSNLVDRLKDYIFQVCLYEVGEPLHHKDVMKFVEYASQRRIATLISSSLSIERPDEFWEELVQSGLDRLIVAIDGVTEEVYQKYRTNGNFGLVMSNLRKILRCKQRANNRMIIEWQMVDLPWNKEEQHDAKNLAKEIGCNEFTIIPEAQATTVARSKTRETRMKNCFLPYVIFIVNAYNRVLPCYKLYTNEEGETISVGDLNMSSFEEVWNCEEFIRIRDKNRIAERFPCKHCQEC